MTLTQDPAPRPQSIAARLYRTSFKYYALVAVALTVLLVAGEFWSTRSAIQREMATYQNAFAPTLATALWAMDADKLHSITVGMVEIPEIVGVRIIDPGTGHLFAIALKSPEGITFGHDDSQRTQWGDVAKAAMVRHSFDILHSHATGTSLLARAELLSGRPQLIERIRSQSALIVAIALFKEAVLWAIFLLVSRRMLVRPLAELIGALDSTAPENPGRISLPPATEPIIAGTELMVVRDTVNTLIDRIQAHRTQLIALNNDLEHQVAERTSALEEANEILRQQAQRLSESNTELEQFAYVASHDLRQPLRMVSSYLTLLERGYADRLDADAHIFIGHARDGARRMDRLIVDLLALSRIGRTRKAFEAIPFSDVLAGALAVLRPEFDGQGVTFTSPPDLPVVQGDADELIRLMTNLLGNAVKYRSPDRSPVISLGWRLGETGAPLFWVQDNGIGIPSQDTDRVFQVFQRLHGSGTYEGTGIGLAICKKVVEHHGGHIWVESEPDAGSKFFFDLGASAPLSETAGT